MIVLVVCGFSAVAPAQKPQAVLPEVYIDTTWNPPVGGTTWAAHNSAQLSSAIMSAAPGDIIVLDAGATYNGYFALPPKSNPNNKWIYIVSSAIANLPPGTRVSPASASSMAKIVTPNVAATFQVNGGANHWRLAGLELTAASSYPSGCPANGKNCLTYFLMGSQSNPAPLPDSFVIDRCYIHGSPTQDLQSAVMMNWSNSAIIDSFVDEIHYAGFDSVGVGAYYSPGPFKIVNNYIAAATENIMFGGAGGNNNLWVPSDIEIRNNWLYKPLAWVDLSVNQRKMVVKNALELKSAQRVLFDGNIIENVWANGQQGYAIVLTVRTSQSGDIAVVNDITITNNVLKNVVSGFNTLGADDGCGAAGGYPNCHNAGSQDHWNISDNLIIFYDPTMLGGSGNVGIAFKQGLNRPLGTTPPTLGFIQDVVFQHNTLIPAASKPCSWGVYFGNASGYTPAPHLTNNIWIQDNALCRQTSGDNGWQGTVGLQHYMGNPSTAPYDINARYYGNAMYVAPGDRVQSFPPHNYATTVPFNYVNPASYDYQLSTPNWTDTSDGNTAGISSTSLPAPY